MAEDEGVGCEDVWLSYKVDMEREVVLERPRAVLKGASMKVARGGRVVMIGRNGAGKSSLMRVLAGVATPERGEVRVAGKSWANERRFLNGKVALVGTGRWGSGSSTASLGVGELADGAEKRALEDDSASASRVNALRKALRIDRLVEKRTDQLSDGELRAVQLFVALAPPGLELILLDEACMELDVRVRAGLYDYLRTVTSTVVYATHVFDGLAGFAETVLAVGDGRVEAFKAEADPYTQARRVLECPARTDLPMVNAMAADDTTVVIQVEGLTWRYAPGRPPALEDCSLKVRRGRRVVLVGANGSGKSTLLALLGGARLAAGVEGLDVLGAHPSRANLRADGRVALLGGAFKSALNQLPPRAAEVRFSDLLAAVLRAHSSGNTTPVQVLAKRASDLVAALAVDPAWKPAAASAGQQTRMQLVLQLATPAQVYLVDELTRDLDLEARDAVLAFLANDVSPPGQKIPPVVVYATHIFQGLDAWATDVVYLRHGTVFHASDDTSDLYNRAVAWLADEDRDTTCSENPSDDPKPDSRQCALPAGWAFRDNAVEAGFGAHSWSARAAHGRFADSHAAGQRFEALYLAAPPGGSAFATPPPASQRGSHGLPR